MEKLARILARPQRRVPDFRTDALHFQCQEIFRKAGNERRPGCLCDGQVLRIFFQQAVRLHSAPAAQADEFIQKIPAGYEGIIAEKGASLSGGQKQRLSISRAVLKKPEILILDDSTSALDLGTEAKLRAEIDRKMNGTTLIIIAQRIQSVKSCDRIAVLDHGKLCACDTHENLLKTCEVYQDIYASQVKTSGGEV